MNGLVDIKNEIPGILIDLKYASTDNFTGKVIYDFNECKLVPQAVQCLKQVQSELHQMGLGLKVWDAYRPMSAQWKLWNLVQDERYVSDPRKGGRHTRGTAVDVTLVRGDVELAMPTGFDDFSEKAWKNYAGEKEAVRNRELLITIMEKNGFAGIDSEWWHFDLINWKQFPIIGIIE